MSAEACRTTPAFGEGRCLCGAVRFEWRAPPLWSEHCHCESCRRQCSAPMTSFFAVADDAWEWTGETPKRFDSSPDVRRYFCGTCGSPMAYQVDTRPGETHFYAASMETPEAFVPEGESFPEERLPWGPRFPDLSSRDD